MVSDRERVAECVDRCLADFYTDPQVPRSLMRVAREHPELFFAAAVKRLDSDADTPAYRHLAGLVMRMDSFSERLANPMRCSCESAVRLFRRLLLVDPTLDFRLARALPGRNDAGPEKVLTGGHAARAIEILDQTSPGQRLMSVIGHLPNSLDPKISAKAALFVGRRQNNPAWTAKQLQREDHRVRANALEAVWGKNSGDTVRILDRCTEDENNRVAGNALIGLHMAGCQDVSERALAMSKSDEPGRRSTAAWAMGKIGKAEFIERLTALLKDENARVRSTAIRSLVEIGKVETKRIAAEQAKQEAVRVKEEQKAATAAPVEPEMAAPVFKFDLRLDGRKI